MKELKINLLFLSVEVDTTSISEEMSQVKLKEVELIGLKQQNQNLEDISLKKRRRKEEARGEMSRINKPKCQVNKAGDWTNGLARGQAFDLG